MAPQQDSASSGSGEGRRYPRPADFDLRAREGETSEQWAQRVTFLPEFERVVAIGDIHGDYWKGMEALMAAGVMSEDCRWIGGETLVVQMGDILDRGHEEIHLLELFAKLKVEALEAGGQIITMIGNHELLNLCQRYYTASVDGCTTMAEWFDTVYGDMEELVRSLLPYSKWLSQFLEQQPESNEKGLNDPNGEFVRLLQSGILRGRVFAYSAGSPVAMRHWSESPVALVVGKTVFAHGGVTPFSLREHGLVKMNADTRDFVCNREGRNRFFKYQRDQDFKPTNPRLPKCLDIDLGPGTPEENGQDNVLWSRKYSEVFPAKVNYKDMEEACELLGVTRHVVAHTPQTIINAVCTPNNFFDIIRIDVGMCSLYFNGRPQVLEIVGDKYLDVIAFDAQVHPVSYEDFLRNKAAQAEAQTAATINYETETEQFNANNDGFSTPREAKEDDKDWLHRDDVPSGVTPLSSHCRSTPYPVEDRFTLSNMQPNAPCCAALKPKPKRNHVHDYINDPRTPLRKIAKHRQNGSQAKIVPFNLNDEPTNANANDDVRSTPPNAKKRVKGWLSLHDDAATNTSPYPMEEHSPLSNMKPKLTNIHDYIKDPSTPLMKVAKGKQTGPRAKIIAPTKNINMKVAAKHKGTKAKIVAPTKNMKGYKGKRKGTKAKNAK